MLLMCFYHTSKPIWRFPLSSRSFPRLGVAELERCGVMVGITSTEYGQLAAAPRRPLTPFDASGHLTLSVAAGRVSYTFGMRGPSFPGLSALTADLSLHGLIDPSWTGCLAATGSHPMLPPPWASGSGGPCPLCVTHVLRGLSVSFAASEDRILPCEVTYMTSRSVAAVDTVCSSSLVSTHLACRALAAGDCGKALSAGVNLLLAPRTTAMCQAAGMLALDGRCKALDAAADGYGRAEAAGALLLAPVSASQPALVAMAGDEQGDHRPPLVLLAGTAVNQDGRSSSLTTPNGPAQQARRQARA